MFTESAVDGIGCFGTSDGGDIDVWRMGGAWWIYPGGPLRVPLMGPFDDERSAKETLRFYLEHRDRESMRSSPPATDEDSWYSLSEAAIMAALSPDPMLDAMNEDAA